MKKLTTVITSREKDLTKEQFFLSKFKNMQWNGVIKKKRKKEQKQLPRGVLRNFAKFTGKQLCQSPFFNKVAGQRPEARDLQL